jgi:uncharacterized lipoprotein NlpE involved in copper resistance
MNKIIKAIVALLSLLFLLTLNGCDNREDSDYDIRIVSHYIDVTQQLVIDSYNGFTFTKFDVEKQDDGTYTFTIRMSNPIVKGGEA